MLSEAFRRSSKDEQYSQMDTSSPDSSPITECGTKPLMAKAPSRPSWDNKLQFILATVGFAVGLGNIWRFPYLCYKNGGGAFLLPYLIMLIVEGIPLLYLELSVGQRLRKGSFKAWLMISPYMGGVGLASLVICIFTATYYSVVLSWFFFYFVKSFQATLPWSKCPTEKSFNLTLNRSVGKLVDECAQSNSVLYFFFRETLNVSESIEETTTWNWKIMLCYIAVWIIIYVCVIKGIKTSGKVVYFTATFPYVVLTAFFIRGLTIDGFDAGIRHLFSPKWKKLADPIIWLEAAGQVFYSTGLGFGCIVAFASYNPIHENTLKDSIVISLVNSGTSLFASVVVFSILGFRATINMRNCEKENSLINSTLANNTKNVCDFDKLLEQAAAGPGLVFIAFSDAMRNMPAAPVWSVLFFLMCISLGIDSLFGGLESISASLADLKRFSKVRIAYLSGGICFTCFLLGLCMLQDSGNYIVQLFDTFSANIAVLVVAICEFIFVTWIYGFERFSQDIWFMTGSKPGKWWKLCWMVLSPLLVVCILISSFVHMTSKPLKYSAWISKGEMIELKFPSWAVLIGVFMTILSVGLIPAVAILRFFGIPRYTKEYPPPIRDSPDNTQQTFIVNNDDAKDDVNQNKQWGKKEQKKYKVESFV